MKESDKLTKIEPSYGGLFYKEKVINADPK